MGVRPVSRLPDGILKRRAEEVGVDVDHSLIDDLLATMKASPACVGLAAPQIGVSQRVIAVDVSEHPKTTASHGLVVMIDPVLVDSSGHEIAREGCMSVPDLTANVARASEVVVKGRSPDGEHLLVATQGFEARAFQHEMDHLDGFVILDRVASLSTDVFRRRVYR